MIGTSVYVGIPFFLVEKTGIGRNSEVQFEEKPDEVVVHVRGVLNES